MLSKHLAVVACTTLSGFAILIVFLTAVESIGVEFWIVSKNLRVTLTIMTIYSSQSSTRTGSKPTHNPAREIDEVRPELSTAPQGSAAHPPIVYAEYINKYRDHWSANRW